MFIIRKIIGSILLFLNWIFTPRGVKREQTVQNEIDAQTQNFKLYQFQACPFCIKVRRAMKRMSLNIETRDAKNNDDYRNELESQGGKVKVPCLRIQNDDGSIKWLYESNAIVGFLQEKYAS